MNTGTSGGVGLGYSRVIELPKLDISVIKSDPAKHAAAPFTLHTLVMDPFTAVYMLHSTRWWQRLAMLRCAVAAVVWWRVVLLRWSWAPWPCQEINVKTATWLVQAAAGQLITSLINPCQARAPIPHIHYPNLNTNFFKILEDVYLCSPWEIFAAVYSLRLRMMLTDSVTNNDIHTNYIIHDSDT